jgi:hypothetical protein
VQFRMRKYDRINNRPDRTVQVRSQETPLGSEGMNVFLYPGRSREGKVPALLRMDPDASLCFEYTSRFRLSGADLMAGI